MQTVSINIKFDPCNENQWKEKLSLAARIALFHARISYEDFKKSLESLNDVIFIQYALNQYEHLRRELECNKARCAKRAKHNEEFLEFLESPKFKRPTRAYDRLATIPLDLVFTNLGKTINIMGHTITVRSKRYRCYARKGVTCVRCGKVGHYFAAERQLEQPTQRYHLNLYHADETEKEIMMTVDHIIPKSRGGKDSIENLQPMCSLCNSAKGNMTEEELLAEVSKKQTQDNANDTQTP